MPTLRPSARFRPAASLDTAIRLGAPRIGTTLLVAALLATGGCRPADLPGSGRGPPPSAPSDAPLPPALRARSVQIQDGDSVIVLGSDGIRRTVRLSGIDAPERSQPHADASRRHLRTLLAGRDLEIRPVKYDAFGRLVAQVLVVDGSQAVDAGLAQLQAGLAWYFRRYERDLPASDRPRYAAGEDAARRSRTGLWTEPAPEAPWAFRQREAAAARR